MANPSTADPLNDPLRGEALGEVAGEVCTDSTGVGQAGLASPCVGFVNPVLQNGSSDDVS